MNTTNFEPSLLLASASPRRAELLRQIGVRFDVQVANVPEILDAGEAPYDYVSRLALAKARALALTSVLPVRGADTVVVCDGQVLEKPRDAEHGQAMLLQLSNRRHQVMTGVALVVKSGAEIVTQSLVVSTDVFFGPITAEQARAYWQTTEPQDKAGGYAIQGLGAMFVERIEGSYSNVVGLPLYETAQLLRAFAVPIGQAR
ncbi:MAG: septum formation inhibitor Maf [Sphingobacteriales bacterium]|nr:MAG: septum formation inhibitor Maf [Sphingobacteriales bacterium]